MEIEWEGRQKMLWWRRNSEDTPGDLAMGVRKGIVGYFVSKSLQMNPEQHSVWVII